MTTSDRPTHKQVDAKTAKAAGEYLTAVLEQGDDPVRALADTRHVFGFGEAAPVEGFARVRRAAQLELDRQSAPLPAVPDGEDAETGRCDWCQSAVPLTTDGYMHAHKQPDGADCAGSHDTGSPRVTTPTDAPNPVALGAQLAVDVAAALHPHHAEHLLSAVLGAAQPYLHDGDAEQVHEPHVDARLVKHLAQLLRPVPPSAFVAVVDALAPHLIQPGTPAPVVALPDGQRPTGRELQVLVGISRGYGNAEIGAGLYLAEDTVKTVASRLYRRLGAKDRAHAVGLAYELGILPVAAPLAVAS